MRRHERQAKTPTAKAANRAASRSGAEGPGIGDDKGTRGSTEAVVDPLYNEKFDAMRCALYHESRERWYATLHRLVMFLTALSGAASVGTLLKSAPEWITIALGATVTILTTGDLVLDLSGSARRHARLKEQFYDVLAECEGDTVCDARPHRARLTRIYGAEPPRKHALDYLMWNKAYKSLSRATDEEMAKNYYVVGPVCRLTRHIFSWEGKDFKPRGG